MLGDLSRVNLAELLLDIHLSKRSGILRLTQNDVKKGIYFKEGSIVFAHSNLKNDRLGETLLRLGRITDEEFQIASVDVIEKGKRLGRALWERGFLSMADVNYGVNYQLQQIVYSLFNWDFGDYEFVERERPVYEDIMVDVSTPDLLMNGIRNVTNPAVLNQVLGDDEQRLVEINPGPGKMSIRDYDYTEETILACLESEATLAGLRQMTQLSPLEFGRAMYALMLAGNIRIREAPKEPFVRKGQHHYRVTTRPFDARPLGAGHTTARLKTFSEEEMRKLILDTELSFRENSDEEVLGVLPDSTAKEIEEAYDRLTEVFHPPLYSEERYHDLKDKLKFVCDRLAEAHDRLLEKANSSLPLSAVSLEVDAPQDSTPEILRTPYLELPAVSKEAPEKPSEAVPPPEPAPPQPEEEKKKAPTLLQLEERLKREPANVSLLRELGKKLQNSGKAKEAEKHLLRALEVEPQSVDNHFALAEFYQLQGLKLKAFKHLNIVVQLDPKNERALELMSVKKPKKALYDISSKENS